MIRYYQ